MEVTKLSSTLKNKGTFFPLSLSLLFITFSHFGCTTTIYYVPIAGDRIMYEPSNVREVSPLTSQSEGNERYPQVSPDGKYVAFISRPLTRQGRYPFTSNVYVMDAATGGNLRPITQTELKQEVFYPSWVGNKRLLYVRYDELPDFPTNLYFHDFPPQDMEGYSVLRREQQFWKSGSVVLKGSPSPDGKKIAVCVEVPTYRKGRIDVFRRQPQLENPVVLIYDLATKQAAFFAYGMEPAWSPDGKKIAYSKMIGQNFYIYVKDIESNEERQITFGPDACDWMPCWSPSGKEIAFAAWRYKDWDIWKIGADGNNLVRLTTSPGTEWDPSWGPEGYIYFSFLRKSLRGDYDWDIWRLKVVSPY